jgi:hypothetical protein
MGFRITLADALVVTIAAALGSLLALRLLVPDAGAGASRAADPAMWEEARDVLADLARERCRLVRLRDRAASDGDLSLLLVSSAFDEFLMRWHDLAVLSAIGVPSKADPRTGCPQEGGP